MKLPTRVRFPGGLSIPVKEVARKDMAVAADRATGGFYSHSEKIIWIDKALGNEEKWRILYHEIKHALIEIYDDMVVHKTWLPWKGGK